MTYLLWEGFKAAVGEVKLFRCLVAEIDEGELAVDLHDSGEWWPQWISAKVEGGQLGHQAQFLIRGRLRVGGEKRARGTT